MIDYIYCCFWEVQIEKMYGDFTYFILFGVREEVFSVSPGFFYRLDPLVFGHTETFCPFPFLSVCFLFSGGEVIGDGPRPSRMVWKLSEVCLQVGLCLRDAGRRQEARTAQWTREEMTACCLTTSVMCIFFFCNTV